MWLEISISFFHIIKIWYRVTRRVFSEPVTSKLHLLNTKNLAGHLKTPKVIRISAIHEIFHIHLCTRESHTVSILTKML